MANKTPFFGSLLLLLLLLLLTSMASTFYDGPLYDSTAYTECKMEPEAALYRGGILQNQPWIYSQSQNQSVKEEDGYVMPSLLLHNLTQGNFYCFSTWVRLESANSALIRATLQTEKETYNCIGTVLAKRGCWSFLKGGFVLNSSSTISILFFQTADGGDISIALASPSLQPFTKQQWRMNQEYIINTRRKRAVTIHVSDRNGERLEGVGISVEQVSKDFPFGSAVAKTILGNLPYQRWFVKRFNAVVFENELKWYATEPEPGQVNYTIPDLMMQFVRSNKLIARGHNIFWEDPIYTPPWVRNLTGSDLQSAVTSRIQSLMSRYSKEFVHWDVSNEMLHFDFYERRLGPEASVKFFETARGFDPLATLFLNEFNVVETCSDVKSTVDSYVSRVEELRKNGIFMDGIGLEGHFTVPNPPLIRGVLDKLATLGIPIWFTEVDICKTLDEDTQARYLEDVLREGFSHASVNGIMLWTALHPKGCYQMCLTDDNFRNLPAGDVLDKLLQQWRTCGVEGVTDQHGSFSFLGFLGEYRIFAKYGNTSANSTFSLSQGQETSHFTVTL